MSVNKCLLIGRLGADPELRYTQTGRAVTNFNIATDQVWKDREGQRQKSTEWHRIVVWGPQAESCSKFLRKGREVFVEGEIRSRTYDDRDGNKRNITEIIARDVRFLSGGAGQQDADERGGEQAPYDDGEAGFGFEGKGQGAPSSGKPNGKGKPPPSDEDVPF